VVSVVETPVVLIAFNRPDLTARNLAVLREVRPSRLLLICDGPRAGRPDDAESTAAVRRVLDGVDWPAQVERRFSDENLGCEANVELGLDWAFSQVDRAVVLEDDCIPDPTFFRYCDELLDRYADDPRVWYISGNSLKVPPALFGGADYAFSTWASVWGWATWADRWQQHRKLFPRDHVGGTAGRGDAPVRTVPARPRPGTLVTRRGRQHFAEAAGSDDVVTHGWDKHWWLTIMSEGGLTVTPAVNLVQNAGFGDGATHVGASREAEPSVPVAFPLRHPPEVTLNREVERELELVLARVAGPAARIGRRLVRSAALRRRLRALADGRLVSTVMRAWSRWTGR
jgi:hypothetical protein